MSFIYDAFQLKNNIFHIEDHNFEIRVEVFYEYLKIDWIRSRLSLKKIIQLALRTHYLLTFKSAFDDIKIEEKNGFLTEQCEENNERINFLKN